MTVSASSESRQATRRTSAFPAARPAVAEQFDFDDFGGAAWDAVAPERRTPMQQHIWARAAAETLSPCVRVTAVTVGSLDKPLAVAPLRRDAHWPHRLSLLGADELAEPVEVAYRDQAALEALAGGLARGSRPISFGHYHGDTPFIDALRRAWRGRGVVVARALPTRGSPSIALDRSWLEPESHFSSRRRSDFRRMQRAADKIGKVSFMIAAPTPEIVLKLLDEAIAIEARSWKARSGTALVQNAEQSRFLRRYAVLASEAGILRISFLKIDGSAVAMQIAAETDNRFWLFKVGYDEHYKRCSPGNLLLRETIRYAAGRGLASFEFLGKEAPWTTLWTEFARPLVALRVYPFNFAGAAAAAIDGIGMARRRWWGRQVEPSTTTSESSHDA